MKHILAIDPGTTHSGWCLWDPGNGRVVPDMFGKVHNEFLLELISDGYVSTDGVLNPMRTDLAIEMVASYGMPVGKEVFQTCVWIGKFLDRWESQYGLVYDPLVYRKDIIRHFNGSSKGNDATLRQALMDRFGGKGTKAEPGPFYGVAADAWSAVAIAVYFDDVRRINNAV